MSRKAAKEKFNWKDANRFLRQQGVTLISAGLDEVPMVYKNIHQVMAAQKDLVTILGQFDPKLVKMAPHGERPEYFFICSGAQRGRHSSPPRRAAGLVLADAT